jgi:hypothetical protein
MDTFAKTISRNLKGLRELCNVRSLGEFDPNAFSVQLKWILLQKQYQEIQKV